VEHHLGRSVDGVRIGVWGLTFKANTDDLRESPALEVAGRLQERGAVLSCYDPAVNRSVNGLEVVDSALEAATGAECVILLTEWDEFRWLDFDRVAEVMSAPNIIDTRNILDANDLRRRGFAIRGLGKP